MSKQQLQLLGSKQKQNEVNEKLFAGLFEGQRTLQETLKVDDQTVEELRAQAHALYHAGRWERCIAVVHGLHALGNQELWDPLMLARCFDELGDPDRAAQCARIAETVLAWVTDERNEGARS